MIRIKHTILVVPNLIAGPGFPGLGAGGPGGEFGWVGNILGKWLGNGGARQGPAPSFVQQ